jgi:hypothetical protein
MPSTRRGLRALRVKRQGTVVSALTNALYLAAAPTFAAMAVLTTMSDGNADMMCSAHEGWRLNGMVPMYALMSTFHSGPWLKRILRRLNCDGPRPTLCGCRWCTGIPGALRFPKAC